MKSFSVRGNWLDRLDHWSTPVMANLLWSLLTILVVTFPLAVVGLLGVIFQWRTNRNPQVFSVFFGTIRRTWFKAYIAAALDLFVGGFVLLNLRIFEFIDGSEILIFVSRSVTLSVAILLVLLNIYLWTLIAVWDAPFKRLLKLSIQLVFAQPLWTLAIGIGCAAVVVASTFLPIAVIVVASAAVTAYIACTGMWFVVTKYMLPSEIPLLDVM
ncbi:MAG: DUF624 domain-containing protein [Chloroflexi bacterium]|nr:DUF624 domain-containing protein [Chloroflexota bacterium]